MKKKRHHSNVKESEKRRLSKEGPRKEIFPETQKASCERQLVDLQRMEMSKAGAKKKDGNKCEERLEKKKALSALTRSTNAGLSSER